MLYHYRLNPYWQDGFILWVKIDLLNLIINHKWFVMSKVEWSGMNRTTVTMFKINLPLPEMQMECQAIYRKSKNDGHLLCK